MRSTSLKSNQIMGRINSILIIILVLVSIVSVPLVSFAEQQNTQPQDNRSKAVVKALSIQAILRNALQLNLSTDLKNEIEKLLAVNISTLSNEELSEFIKRGRELLIKIEQEVRIALKTELDNIYAEKLRKTIETKSKIIEKLYNISLTNLTTNLSRITNYKELMKILKSIDKAIDRARTKLFSHQLTEHTILTLNNTIEKFEAKTVAKAYVGLEKAMNILKRVSQKLAELNVSEEVLEHINKAIEHISIAKDILANISTNISDEPFLGNVTSRLEEVDRRMPSLDEVKEKLKKSLNKKLMTILNQVNETIHELKEDVNELIERAMEVNATEIIEKLKPIEQKLNELEKEIQNVNVTRERLREILSILANIRISIKKIEKRLRDQLRDVPVRSISNAFNVTLTKTLKNLEELKEMYRFLEEKSKEIVCIAVYPPPPACRIIEKLPALLDKMNKTIAEVEEMINLAIGKYYSGDTITALHMVVRANSIINVMKAQLRPAYTALLKS